MHIEPAHHEVTFTWRESGPTHAVLLRLVASTDHAQDDGDLGPYLMRPHGDGGWTLTLRLPSTLRSSYQICPITDEPLTGHPTEERWMRILAAGLRDPENPATLVAGTTYGNPGPASILELPGAPPQPWYARRARVARGVMTRHEIGGGVVHVYAPPDHNGGLPVVVMFDGRWWASLDVADTLDNLIADGVVRPMLVVAIESIRGATRQQTLTHQDIFEPFLLEELLPWLEATWNVSRAPTETVLVGQSLGGLTAAFLARRHPDRFGWVIGQSTAAWWPGDGDGGLSGAQVVEAYAAGGRDPVRFFLEVGSRERRLLGSVRLLRDTLQGTDHDVRYREYDGGHDFACWRGGLADGLVAALGHR